MDTPESFSRTAHCPFMDESPSNATVRFSPSSSPVSPATTRCVSFSAEIDGTPRPRVQPVPIRATPPAQSRSKFVPMRMSQSGSFASIFSLARSRSRSKAGPADNDRLTPKLPDTLMMESSTSWFGKACDFIRPWDDDDDEGISIPEEQKQAFVQTREVVCVTLKRIFGCAREVILETLLISIESMEFMPIPGLQGLSKTFLSIWKAVEQVAMNRLAFLRLTQTCASILDSICNEVEQAGDQVARKLSGPISALERSFESCLSLVKSQIETPFLWRYLKRADTAAGIAVCHDSLLTALALFTNTIQIRTFQALCENAQVSAANQKEIISAVEAIVAHPISPQLPVELKRSSAPDGLPYSSSHRSLGLAASPTITSRSTDNLVLRPQVIPALQEIQTAQNISDNQSDIEDLRSTIQSVLNSGNDAKLLSFLGIEPSEMPEAIKTLQRTLDTGSGKEHGSIRDTLHQEFLESGIDALRRMSAGNHLATNLPCWTITKYEVERHRKIGMGFFSEVFQGTWKGQTVAIKVLSEVTPQDLFVREIKVWKSLIHPNILELYGASSATGNHPWFFVSPYMKNGNLVEFLRRISQREDHELQGLGAIAENLPSSRSRSNYGTGFTKLLKINDVYRVLQEIAGGMEYLHDRNVLHGDLKGSNILVDDQCRCVLSDFGQSEMKSEVYRITGSSMQTGTLRWKAPELLDGSSALTAATDIYAYAIVCIEVLTMGRLPWTHEDDDGVRYNVLVKDKRPLVPPEYTSPLLHELISACWCRDLNARAPFTETVGKLHRLRIIEKHGSDPSIASPDDIPVLSPSLSPLSPPSISPSPRPTSMFSAHPSDVMGLWDATDDFVALPSALEVDALQMEDEKFSHDNIAMPEPTHFLPNMQLRHPTLNPYYETASVVDYDGDRSLSADMRRHSLPFASDAFADARNERRYRYLLEHEFNPSLTLALWEPSPVQLGDVGYLLKPKGTFVTLFNALKHHKAAGFIGALPSMAGYGNVSKGSLRLDKRNVAQKGLDVFSGLLTFRSRNEIHISRRHSFRLRAGHKAAHLYSESAEYHYMKKLEAPKAWFKANADSILNFYGQQHGIQKEDLFLVISLLQAPNYALFISHRHPDSHAHFNVFNAPGKGHPWGGFSTETVVPAGHTGPFYEESNTEEHDHATKISNTNEPHKALLLGRLRFKPDSLEPTTAK
ncbi:hypothetical protein M413DRAFT_138529 [Hebeloma cylindrosporum]|uniref:Protein kinase domain-containing protein n=1 Tax=Hebeloma cylindrosporum TaxID=76867 RepID=A0A0C3BYZ7_HEBCY|nr:hypothetical protein M413DRAFT_138529 [Hebeloma cylindrosporum h7]